MVSLESIPPKTARNPIYLASGSIDLGNHSERIHVEFCATKPMT